MHQKRNQKLGKELRAARAKAGLSMTELAKRLKVVPSTVYFYETGKLEPGAHRLFDLARALDLRLDYLAGRVGRRAA